MTGAPLSGFADAARPAAGCEPRVGFAGGRFPHLPWVIRVGYGIYRDTSVYQNIVLQMAQQAPFSKSLSVANSAGLPADAGQRIQSLLRGHPRYICASIPITASATRRPGSLRCSAICRPRCKCVPPTLA